MGITFAATCRTRGDWSAITGKPNTGLRLHHIQPQPGSRPSLRRVALIEQDVSKAASPNQLAQSSTQLHKIRPSYGHYDTTPWILPRFRNSAANPWTPDDAGAKIDSNRWQFLLRIDKTNRPPAADAPTQSTPRKHHHTFSVPGTFSLRMPLWPRKYTN